MNQYNPQIHHRRSIRLKGYDYSQAGAYFITICCDDRVCRFGHIENGVMLLNGCGQIAYNEWLKLAERFTHFELDVFQIMPNHLHGIIVLTVGDSQNDNGNVGATLAVDPTDSQNDNGVIRAGASPARTDDPTVGHMVGAYKSLVFNECLKIYKLNNEQMGKLWQRNYYEHIIRNEQSYQTISNYIVNNPASWKDDKFYK